MATVRSSLQLYDGMTNTLNRITQSVSIMLNTFDATQSAVSAGFDAAAMDSARMGIAQASAELVRYNEELQRAATIPEPKIPEPTWQALSPQNVFMSSGSVRFEEELRSADVMARQLAETQQRISGQARSMRVTPPGMLNDVAAVGNRMQMLSARVQRLNSIPVDLRTDQTNSDLEGLRGNLERASQVQERLSSAMARMDINDINAQFQRLNGLLANAEGGIRNMDVGQQQFNNRVRDGTSGFKGMFGIIAKIGATLGAALGVGKIIELSDTMTQVTARINLMKGESESVADVQERIFQSAQRSRTEYLATADVISKLGMRAGDAFGSTNEVIQFAENLNKQFVIAGASQQEIASASLQLTQALGSGVLRGEELNAVFEAAPNVIQTIADHLGVMGGEIRGLASDGVITADIVKNAMLGATDSINAEFAKMPRTFGQVWIGIKNNALMAFQPILQRLNDIANSTGFQNAVNGIIAGLRTLSSISITVFDALIQGVSWLGENWGWIEPIIWGVVAAMVVYNAKAGIAWLTTLKAAAAMAWKTVCDVAEIIALFALTVAQEGLNAALYACPITWIIIAVIALIAIFYAAVGAVNKFAGTSISATGLIGGAIAVWASSVINQFIHIWNIIADVVNFFANVWNDPISAVKILFLDLASSVIGYMINIAKAIEDIINAIPGMQVDITSNAENFKREIEDIASKVKSESEWKEVMSKKELIDYGDAAKKGYEIGSGIEDRVKDIFGGGGVGDEIRELMEGIGNNTGATAGNTAKMADTMDIMDEELKYMRDAAEQEVINRFTLAELKVDVSNSNTLTKKTDFDDMGRYLASFTNEFLASAAEGGHL